MLKSYTMMFAKVYSAQTKALDAELITIESDISGNTNSFNLIGLPDKSIDEAKERINAALKNLSFPYPKKFNKNVVISLLPSSVKKRGSIFDVPIAISYLKAIGEIKNDINDAIFIGELSLSGKILPVKGVLPITLFAKNKKFKKIFVPKENAKEAALISGIDVYPADFLSDIVNHLKGIEKIKKQVVTKLSQKSGLRQDNAYLDDIVGHEFAKRAIIISAAGHHNIAMHGIPGVGKSMLAKTLANLLPELTLEESIEVSSIYSVSGKLDKGIITRPPFRDPHHSSSFTAIVGGGTEIKPGEISLAHKGVLFFDELAEYESRAINALRQPMEQRYITISRAKETARYPADFLFVAALNPCPCGYYGTDKCTCMPHQIKRYQGKIPGPIIDRIDMWIEVEKVSYEEILSKKISGDKIQHKKAKEIIKKAQEVQIKRQGKLNAYLSSSEISNIPLSITQKSMLKQAAESMNLSLRVVHKIIKVARTIADIDECTDIKDEHILEAIGYRNTIKTDAY